MKVFKEKPSVENYDFKVFGYISDLLKYVVKLEKELIIRDVVTIYFTDRKEALSYLKRCCAFEDERSHGSDQFIINMANIFKTEKMSNKD